MVSARSLPRPDQRGFVRDLDVDPFQRAGGVAALAGAAGPEATVLMVYTSGTTGQAKGAMLSENAMHYAVLNGIDHQGLTAEDCTIAPLPTFHVGGLNIQTLPTLYVGGQVVLQRRFDPAGVLALVAEHKATQTLLVPAMLAAVASQPNFRVYGPVLSARDQQWIINRACRGHAAIL